jgi:hypothetical protein
VTLDLDALRRAVHGEEPIFVRWRAEIADAVPELTDAVERFDPGALPSAVFCAEWLRDAALGEPQTSVPRLYVQTGRLLGFYAPANGEAQLRSRDRQRAGLSRGRPTQPAVLLTHIARAQGEPPGTGQALMNHAIATAREATALSAATVLALDPYDEATAKTWAERYRFRNATSPGPGRPEGLFRMWLPLSTRD